jgi:hypothetical protein
MVVTKYIDRFINNLINKHIPEGIDPLLHVNSRDEIRKLILHTLQHKNYPLRLSHIKWVIINYKKILYNNLSVLN